MLIPVESTFVLLLYQPCTYIHLMYRHTHHQVQAHDGAREAAQVGHPAAEITSESMLLSCQELLTFCFSPLTPFVWNAVNNSGKPSPARTAHCPDGASEEQVTMYTHVQESALHGKDLSTISTCICFIMNLVARQACWTAQACARILSLRNPPNFITSALIILPELCTYI